VAVARVFNLLTFAGPGAGTTGLTAPRGVVTDEAQNLFIADTGNNRIIGYVSVTILIGNNLPSSVNGSAVIVAGISATLSGTLHVAGNLTIAGKLVVSSSSLLTVAGGITVQGNLHSACTHTHIPFSLSVALSSRPRDA
jgi:hypothetical protein